MTTNNHINHPLQEQSIGQQYRQYRSIFIELLLTEAVDNHSTHSRPHS